MCYTISVMYLHFCYASEAGGSFASSRQGHETKKKDSEEALRAEIEQLKAAAKEVTNWPRSRPQCPKGAPHPAAVTTGSGATAEVSPARLSIYVAVHAGRGSIGETVAPTAIPVVPPMTGSTVRMETCGLLCRCMAESGMPSSWFPRRILAWGRSDGRCQHGDSQEGQHQSDQ